MVNTRINTKESFFKIKKKERKKERKEKETPTNDHQHHLPIAANGTNGVQRPDCWCLAGALGTRGGRRGSTRSGSTASICTASATDA